jgi:Resolvase, N terminal domain
VIATLDRLSRNAAFLLNLRDAGVDFICADMLQVNQLTIGILALVAQQEREAISARTKAALAAAKAHGKVLGTPRNLTDAGRAKRHNEGLAVRVQRAVGRASDLAPVVAAIRRSGIVTRHAGTGGAAGSSAGELQTCLSRPEIVDSVGRYRRLMFHRYRTPLTPTARKTPPRALDRV